MVKNVAVTTAAIFFLFAMGGYGQEEVILPQTVGVFGEFYPVFQGNAPILVPDGRKKKIHPFYQYLELNAGSPKDGVFFNTFLRGREVLGGEDRTFDVYNAFFEFTNRARTFEIRLGRQLVVESTNLFLLDGGLVRISPIDGIRLVAYGGYQDRDSQPDPEEPLKSFSVFGFKLISDRLLGSIVSVGYELFDSDDFSPRHFLSFSFSRVLPFTRSADVYSRVEFDMGQEDLSLFTLGVGFTPLSVLHLNLEYDTYKPDDDRNGFLQDAIFDLFSVSRLHEARFGVTYIPTSFLEVSSSYSFTSYDVTEGVSTSGHILRLGFIWDLWRQLGLKAFQRFYFIDGRKDDKALGFNFLVSEEILRGLNIHFAFAYAHFKKVTDQDGDAFSYITGVQYLLIRNLLLRSELEVNSNPDFKRDIRINLGINYYFSRNE